MTTLIKKLRTPALGVGLVVASILAAPVHAAKQEKPNPSREENIGVLSGLAVGAVAGGPIGAIVGAAAGAWLGDRYHKQAERNEALAASLGQVEMERSRLAGNLTELKGSFADVQANRGRLIDTLDRTNSLTATVGFRTGDAQLSEDDAERLQKIGQLVSGLPGARVRVTGYADPRGSKEFNQALSERRAAAVAAVLTEAGISSHQIITEGMGEEASTSAEGDLDGYALERRVVVRIEHGGPEALASIR